jgi:hypothetical protein
LNKLAFASRNLYSIDVVRSRVAVIQADNDDTGLGIRQRVDARLHSRTLREITLHPTPESVDLNCKEMEVLVSTPVSKEQHEPRIATPNERLRWAVRDPDRRIDPEAELGNPQLESSFERRPKREQASVR